MFFINRIVLGINRIVLEYYFGLIAIVTRFGLLMFCISYKPTCFFFDLSCTLNFFQKSSDTCNLSKIFDFVKTSKIISLESFSLTVRVVLQIKTKKLKF